MLAHPYLNSAILQQKWMDSLFLVLPLAFSLFSPKSLLFPTDTYKMFCLTFYSPNIFLNPFSFHLTPLNSHN